MTLMLFQYYRMSKSLKKLRNFPLFNRTFFNRNLTLPHLSQKWFLSSECLDLTWISKRRKSLKIRPHVSQMFWLWWYLTICFRKSPSPSETIFWHPIQHCFPGWLAAKWSVISILSTIVLHSGHLSWPVNSKNLACLAWSSSKLGLDRYTLRHILHL